LSHDLFEEVDILTVKNFTFKHNGVAAALIMTIAAMIMTVAAMIETAAAF
jgi:hypothetical protein